MVVLMQNKTKGKEYLTLNLGAGVAILSLFRVDLEKPLTETMKKELEEMFKTGKKKAVYVEAEFDTENQASTMNKFTVRYADGSIIEKTREGNGGNRMSHEEIGKIVNLINILFKRDLSLVTDSGREEFKKLVRNWIPTSKDSNTETDQTDKDIRIIYENGFVTDQKTGEKRLPTEEEKVIISDILRIVSEEDVIISDNMSKIFRDMLKFLRNFERGDYDL
jgi:hypothetical protein